MIRAMLLTPCGVAAAILLSSWSILAEQTVVITTGQSSVTTTYAVAGPSSDEPQSIDASQGGSAQLSGPASFSIAGTVVSATTGTPLDRAEITLFTSGTNGSQVADTLASEDGSFRFDHLQAGRYRLQGYRRGYIVAGYQEHEGYATGIVVGPHLDTSRLHLTLYPTAVIGGTVTSDTGEPIAGAQVRLFRQDQRSGEERVIGTQTEITDDNGTYEFSRVRAGTFYIAVSSSPWYAFHPRPATDESGDPLPPDQQPRSPLDVAYPTTYYPNGTDSDSATPITVNPGDHVEADFSLHAVPAIHIQIRLQPPSEGRGIPMPQLMQQVFNSDEYQPTNEFTVGTQGGGMVADLSGIAPGRYVLRQFGEPGEGNRSASVDLTTDQSLDFASNATAGVEVSGKLAMASGGKFPGRARVSLVPAEGGQNREGERVAEDGTFALHSVPPGRYDVEVAAPDARLAVQQMMATGAEVSGNRLTIAGQPVTLAAILARGTTTINGYAKQNSKGLGGVMILLVPRSPHAGTDLYRRDQTNTDGSFTLNRVIPGDYTLVAIESGWTLEWARPEVMAPYLARGVRVTVTGQREMQLPAAVEVQPR